MVDIIKYPVAWQEYFDKKLEMAQRQKMKDAGDRLNKSLDEGYELISTVPLLLPTSAYLIYTLYKKPDPVNAVAIAPDAES